MTNEFPLLIKSSLATTKKKRKKKQTLTPTYCDPVLLVVDPHLILFPVDSGLGVASGGNALQDGRFPSGHHCIRGVLSEVVSQHCGAEQRGEEALRRRPGRPQLETLASNNKKDNKTKPTKKVFVQIKL